jgi:hypothetical protein
VYGVNFSVQGLGGADDTGGGVNVEETLQVGVAVYRVSGVKSTGEREAYWKRVSYQGPHSTGSSHGNTSIALLFEMH